MNRSFSLAVIASLALILFSCKPGRDGGDTATVIGDEEEFIPFEFNNFNAYDSCSTSVISIRANIPKANGNEAAEKIRNELLMKLNNGKSTDKNPQKLIDEILALEKIELGSLYRDFADTEGPGYESLFEYRYSVSPYFAEQDIIVFDIDCHGYMGGTHGFFQTTFLCYNKFTGERISLGEIFTNTSPVGKLLRTKAAKEYVKENNLDDSEADMFYEDEVKLTDNFTVDRDYIYFQYDEYELGPSCIGLPLLKLSKNDVKQYVIPDSPIYRLWFE